MNLLSVVTPTSIYHGWYNRRGFCEEKFTPVNMRSCGFHNVRKYIKIKNSEHYIALDISLQLDCLDKRELTSSGSRYIINPTMTGGGRLVLIRGQTCRALLGDKGNPLSHKVIRARARTRKIQRHVDWWMYREGIMVHVRTKIYAYERDRSVYCTRSKR